MKVPIVILLLLVATVTACPQPGPADILSPVVKVRTIGSVGSGTCIGSFKGGSLILTNWHVAYREGAYTVEQLVRTPTKEEFKIHKARRIYHDKSVDLAFVWTVAHLPSAPLLPGYAQLLERTWLVGFPDDRESWVTPGMITSRDARLDSAPKQRFLGSSSPIWYGNSGGALFVHRGGKWYLAGVPTRVSVYKAWGIRPVTVPHMSYSVPAEVVREFLLRWALDTVPR